MNNTPSIDSNRKLARRTMGICLIVVLVLLIFWWQRPHTNSKSLTTRVTVVPVKTQPMPILLQAPGRIESIQSVAIVSRVTGTITKINFHQGDMVAANQLLFEIDPAPFLASLSQAEAILKRDEAQLAQHLADAKRYENLVKQQYISKQQYEQAITAKDAQAALVASDRAQVNQAKIQLEYTKIRTPIMGKTGKLNIKVGDLAVATNPTPLVTVNQLDPVWVNFNLPQNDLITLLHYQDQKAAAVNILSENGATVLGKGEVKFINNAVDPQTGTILLKAKISNPNHILWPGLMVSVQLVVTVEPNAIVVPITAVQLDQKGNFVYIVVQNKVVLRRVKLSRQIGDLAVIEQGLLGSEQVITSIPPNLAEGMLVTAVGEQKS